MSSSEVKLSLPSAILSVGISVSIGIFVGGCINKTKKKPVKSPVLEFADKVIAMNSASKKGFFYLYKNGVILDQDNQVISQKTLEAKFKIKFIDTETKELAFTSPLVPNVIFRTNCLTNTTGLPLKKTMVSVPGLIAVLYTEDEYLCLAQEEE